MSGKPSETKKMQSVLPDDAAWADFADESPSPPPAARTPKAKPPTAKGLKPVTVTLERDFSALRVDNGAGRQSHTGPGYPEDYAAAASRHAGYTIRSAGGRKKLSSAFASTEKRHYRTTDPDGFEAERQQAKQGRGNDAFASCKPYPASRTDEPERRGRNYRRRADSFAKPEYSASAAAAFSGGQHYDNSRTTAVSKPSRRSTAGRPATSFHQARLARMAWQRGNKASSSSFGPRR